MNKTIMRKNRMVYCYWLVLGAVLHLFANQFGTRVVLIGSIVIPMFFMFMTWRASRSVSIVFDAPKDVKKGDALKIQIQTIGTDASFAPVHGLIICKNLLTNEKQEIRYNTNNKDCTFVLPHCGMHQISIDEPTIMDVFGLSAWRVKHSKDLFVCVMPTPIHVEAHENGISAAVGDEYSTQRPGYDVSEVFGMRDYMPGDSLRSIHWKLSNKTDNLLVREFGLPLNQKILILVETSLPQNTPQDQHKSIDYMADLAWGVSNACLVDHHEHAIGWLDTTSLMYQEKTIQDVMSAHVAFDAFLSNTMRHCETTAIQAYQMGATASHFGRIMYLHLDVNTNNVSVSEHNAHAFLQEVCH